MRPASRTALVTACGAALCGGKVSVRARGWVKPRTRPMGGKASNVTLHGSGRRVEEASNVAHRRELLDTAHTRGVVGPRWPRVVTHHLDGVLKDGHVTAPSGRCNVGSGQRHNGGVGRGG